VAEALGNVNNHVTVIAAVLPKELDPNDYPDLGNNEDLLWIYNEFVVDWQLQKPITMNGVDRVHHSPLAGIGVKCHDVPMPRNVTS
jgi:hypothetical protein